MVNSSIAYPSKREERHQSGRERRGDILVTEDLILRGDELTEIFTGEGLRAHAAAFFLKEPRTDPRAVSRRNLVLLPSLALRPFAMPPTPLPPRGRQPDDAPATDGDHRPD